MVGLVPALLPDTVDSTRLRSPKFAIAPPENPAWLPVSVTPIRRNSPAASTANAPPVSATPPVTRRSVNVGAPASTWATRWPLPSIVVCRGAHAVDANRVGNRELTERERVGRGAENDPVTGQRDVDGFPQRAVAVADTVITVGRLGDEAVLRAREVRQKQQTGNDSEGQPDHGRLRATYLSRLDDDRLLLGEISHRDPSARNPRKGGVAAVLN